MRPMVFPDLKKCERALPSPALVTPADALGILTVEYRETVYDKTISGIQADFAFYTAHPL